VRIEAVCTFLQQNVARSLRRMKWS